MLKVKLIDLKTVTVKDVQFGTCELCMHTEDLDETTWVFEDRATGKTHRIDGQEWCWGMLLQVPPVENVADFAAWLKDRDASNEHTPYTFGWLRELVEEYLDQDCDCEPPAA